METMKVEVTMLETYYSFFFFFFFWVDLILELLALITLS